MNESFVDNKLNAINDLIAGDEQKYMPMFSSSPRLGDDIVCMVQVCDKHDMDMEPADIIDLASAFEDAVNDGSIPAFGKDNPWPLAVEKFVLNAKNKQS